jgi:hypothetical protein
MKPFLVKKELVRGLVASHMRFYAGTAAPLNGLRAVIFELA